MKRETKHPSDNSLTRSLGLKETHVSATRGSEKRRRCCGGSEILKDDHITNETPTRINQSINPMNHKRSKASQMSERK